VAQVMKSQTSQTCPFARLSPRRLAIGIAHRPTLVEKHVVLSILALDPSQYTNRVFGQRDPNSSPALGRLRRDPRVRTLQIHAAP
jgi:hypothetical protein